MTALLLQITRADVSRMLRDDALKLGLGLLLVAVGAAAAAVYLRRLRGSEPLLPWFGAFAILYGLRLLARTSTFPLLFELPPRFWDHLAAVITYVVPVPAVLILRAAFPRWRRPLGWTAAAVGAFAAGAVVADLMLQRPYSARLPNNVLAITFLVVSLGLLFRPGLSPGRDLRTLRLGLASQAATAIVDNLRGLDLLAWPPFELEPLGFTVLIACLGAIAGRRALDNAQRLLALDKELNIARRIQTSILPGTMPAVAGLAVAARYQPAAAVAGDFYDFLELGPGRLGVLVADVSGHGVPAALIASMVKVAIAAQRAQGEHPAAVLVGMNETLGGRLGGQYVTAAYVFLDRERGLMRYGAAGHPPLLRWRSGAPGPEAIEENGLPLGLLDLGGYTEREEPLRSGDRFLLYTDGLVEASTADDRAFGVEGVAAAMAAGAAGSTEALAASVVEASLAWAGHHAADDVTLVLVDCL